jgi:hypothetical protein
VARHLAVAFALVAALALFAVAQGCTGNSAIPPCTLGATCSNTELCTGGIPELRHVHALLGEKQQDPGNFRRKFERMLEDGIIQQAPGKRITASKPAAVYRFTGGRGKGT